MEDAVSKYNKIIFKRAETISTITFNRPSGHNAMDKEMSDELADAVRAVKKDRECRFLGRRIPAHLLVPVEALRGGRHPQRTVHRHRGGAFELLYPGRRRLREASPSSGDRDELARHGESELRRERHRDGDRAEAARHASDRQ